MSAAAAEAVRQQVRTRLGTIDVGTAEDRVYVRARARVRSRKWETGLRSAWVRPAAYNSGDRCGVTFFIIIT